MSFIDEVKIYAKGGDGGNGCASFRREKYVPMGGPDGGDGGKGGSVILVADDSLNTLMEFRLRPHVFGVNGRPGSGNCCTGSSGEDTYVRVPVGTQVFTEEDELVYDLDINGAEYVLVSGGRGGAGNVHYKTSVNQSPRKFKEGEEGEYGVFRLKLKILCDVGIIGFPNAGKSTLINRCSACGSHVADYPFTTLRPYLGVMDVYNNILVMADLPGLIEGASNGVGLGHRFLKHIERCRVILHLVDSVNEDVVHSYSCIRKELDAYSPELSVKFEILALSKCDLIQDTEILNSKVESLKKFTGKDVLTLGLDTDLTKLKQSLYCIFFEKKDEDHEKKRVFSPI